MTHKIAPSRLPGSTFADRVIAFNQSLSFNQPLPDEISVMNPFRENCCATPASRAFYHKYYNDNRLRGIILGINPGRFGAGITGVPFTDPKRLRLFCGIDLPECPPAHEPSSEFIYEVVEMCGGPEAFYSNWYINSICPLGFTKATPAGKEVNYNYYDRPALEKAALPFILKTLPEQIALGVSIDCCFCLGTGKNAAFLNKINAKYSFFGRIIALEHPRYIMQYKSRQRKDYAQKYANYFREFEENNLHAPSLAD